MKPIVLRYQLEPPFCVLEINPLFPTKIPLLEPPKFTDSMSFVEDVLFAVQVNPPLVVFSNIPLLPVTHPLSKVLKYTDK